MLKFSPIYEKWAKNARAYIFGSPDVLKALRLRAWSRAWRPTCLLYGRNKAMGASHKRVNAAVARL